MNIRDHAEDLIEQARQKPRDFWYHGDLDQYHSKATWGPVWGQSRDSDVVERSNWDVVTKALTEKFGGESEENGWIIERASHWAVGWVESITIKLVDKENEPTPQTLMVTELHCSKADYPVLDEDDFYKKEWEEFVSTVKCCLSLPSTDEVEYEWHEDFDEEWDEITSRLVSHFSANRWEDLPAEEEIHAFLIESKMVVPEE